MNVILRSLEDIGGGYQQPFIYRMWFFEDIKDVANTYQRNRQRH